MAGRGARRGRGERGASAVEFALVAPVLLLIVFGIVQYGLMFSLRQTLSQASAEGARAAAVAQSGVTSGPYSPSSEAQSAVVAALGSSYACSGGLLTKSGTEVGTCVVASTTAACPSGTCTTWSVTLTYDYSAHPIVPSVLVPLPKTLSYVSSAQGSS
jgi:Flp pilus assembly protein TadG